MQFHGGITIHYQYVIKKQQEWNGNLPSTEGEWKHNILDSVGNNGDTYKSFYLWNGYLKILGNFGAAEMAQSVKYPPHRHKELSSDF